LDSHTTFFNAANDAHESVPLVIDGQFACSICKYSSQGEPVTSANVKKKVLEYFRHCRRKLHQRCLANDKHGTEIPAIDTPAQELASITRLLNLQQLRGVTGKFTIVQGDDAVTLTCTTCYKVTSTSTQSTTQACQNAFKHAQANTCKPPQESKKRDRDSPTTPLKKKKKGGGSTRSGKEEMEEGEECDEKKRFAGYFTPSPGGEFAPPSPIAQRDPTPRESKRSKSNTKRRREVEQPRTGPARADVQDLTEAVSAESAEATSPSTTPSTPSKTPDNLSSSSSSTGSATNTPTTSSGVHQE
jgi:hypothetical protein